MKMLFVLVGQTVAGNVLEALQRRGVTGYTRWESVQGEGRAGGPHLGTHVWPATNHALACVVADELVPELLAELRELRRQFPREGLQAFVWTVEATL
jgi:hypothetical protein